HHTRADGSSLHESDCRISQSFYRGEGTHGDDEVLWRADGTSFFAEYWSYPVRRDGELVGAVVTFLDITERKHAEDLARTSEQRVRALMEHANDAIFISSTEGVVLEVNRAAEALQGLRREDMIGCPVAELVPAEERERVGRSFGKIISEGSLEGFETFSIRPDGTRVPVEVSASLVEVGGARVVNAIVRDVSERRRAEEQLRGSEERYRLLFENNPQQMWVFDEETFAFLAVNDAACRHYGYSREEFLAMTVRDIRPSEDVPKLLRLLESEPDEFRKSGVWRHRRKDGSLIDVEISSHPLVFDGRPAQLVLTTDVTERLRAEREKRESEERYRVIFDASPLPMWLYDTPSLEIRAVNQAAIGLYGYARQEFLGMTLYDLRSPEEAERLRTMFADIPEPTGRWDKGVWVHRKKDGAPMDIDSHTHEVVVGGRRMRLSVQIDVTDQRRLEGQLRQSQKMEAIGQLAGGVAHDFNNLLTAILGYSDLLATEVGEKSPLLESIDEIRKAGERAASLTRQLLAF
ncbi:MAG TPA: PAS domain S-box protein, partial [Thermoanaerobaculia bacterium]|nr:PAS domain S-box protein [Thermoanaerobaculia bacterium]